MSTDVEKKVTEAEVVKAIRMDKAVADYFATTPKRTTWNRVKIFRASGLARTCPVQAAYVVRAVLEKDKETVMAWHLANQLPSRLIPTLDQGTVIHLQMQYYAGLTGFVPEGQWKCPNCGFFTRKKVPMPKVAVPGADGFDSEYPGKCPKCKGKNLKMYPPWLYVEPELEEPNAEKVRWQFRLTGKCDGIWRLNVRHGKKVVQVRAVADYKSINKNGFTGSYGGGLPKDSHIPQLQAYMAMADLEWGVLVYYCKDNSEMKFCLVKRDRQAWKATMRRIEWARSGSLNGKEKYRRCESFKDPNARACLFCEKCWGKKPPENFLS
jgi:hypothetical protein